MKRAGPEPEIIAAWRTPLRYTSGMSEERKKSAVRFWYATAVLIVYVLMLGPMDGLQSAGRLPEPIATGVRWIYAPLSWVIAHAPESVHKAFFVYVRFWVELLMP